MESPRKRLVWRFCGFILQFGVRIPCHLAVTADSYFDSVETASENLSWNSALGRT